MTNDEIEKAVENLKQCIVENYKDTPVKFSTVDSRDIHTLLILAEEYLKVRGWPEEKPRIDSKYKSVDFLEQDLMNKGFNIALPLCKLASMKEKNKVSKEAIEKIVKSSTLAGYAKNNVWTNDLVVELMELINGKEA